MKSESLKEGKVCTLYCEGIGLNGKVMAIEFITMVMMGCSSSPLTHFPICLMVIEKQVIIESKYKYWLV